MYYSLFGRRGYPRSRTCNCFPRPSKPQEPAIGPCILPNEKGCPYFKVNKRRGNNMHIKSAAFGGLVLLGDTDKRAELHVASLTLDTSGCDDFMVQLNFSCNIITSNTKIQLRFQLFRQEKDQSFSCPLSTGILYCRDIPEANAFTLSICDCDSMISTCCTYSVYAKLTAFEAGGTGIIANPVLIATIIERN